MRRRWWLLALALGASATSLVDATLGTFSDTALSPGNSFAAAGSFCNTPGTQTVTATMDSWVDAASPTTNSGTSVDLFVQKHKTDNWRTIVGFDLPSIPPGCSVTLATLRLNAKAANSGLTIQVYRAASAWTETGVTWNNQPALAGTPATAASGTGWREWTVTQLTIDMYSLGSFGYIVKDQDEGSNPSRTQNYWAREGGATTDPELVITLA